MTQIEYSQWDALLDDEQRRQLASVAFSQRKRPVPDADEFRAAVRASQERAAAGLPPLRELP